MSQHPVSDLMIRLKNGYRAHKETVVSPYSKFREEILKKLKVLGFIKDYTVSGEIIKKIDIILAYPNETAVMTDVKVFSTPGRRMYIPSEKLKPVLGGLGYMILSSSQGILTHVEAKKKKIGGELLFTIW